MHEDELEPVSDEAVNTAYNYFDAERMKYYHDVYVKTNRSFLKKKQEKPEEWLNFASVIRLCRKNGFHLRCYIKYCFINRLVPKSRGKILSDILFLRNYQQVIGYAKNKVEIERLYSIYNSIIKTIFTIKMLNEKNSCSTKETIRSILNCGKLSEYISTGTISPYFFSLMKNSAVIIHKYMNRHSDDITVLNDLCSRIEKYGSDALKSMNMFYPSAMNKSIIQLCD